MTIEVERKILKWGDGWGIRLTAADMEKLGAHAGDVVRAALAREAVRNDFSQFPQVNLGLGRLTSAQTNDMITDDILEKWK